MIRRPPRSTLTAPRVPYTTPCRSERRHFGCDQWPFLGVAAQAAELETSTGDVLHADVRAAVRRQTVVGGAALRRTECRQRRGGLRRIALATQDGDNGEQHGGERRQHPPRSEERR